jgi:long-chain acyl-CoA synthetase
MASVPAVMDKIRKAVSDKVNGGSSMVQWMFNTAYSAKQNAFANGSSTPIWDMLVFNKIKNMLGGELRVMLSGGAPLSADTQKFMNVCFGIPVAQGYGLTETCGATTICNPQDKSYGRVGGPIPSMEIKLKDWEDGGYRFSDKDNKESGLPRGEILMSGANLSTGYYLNEEKTKEEYVADENGKIWFHTGDIGQIHPNGTVQIIDRKKDLVKLQMGEYVSLGKVEASMKGSPFVENVMIYASSMHTYTIAVVQPAGPKIKALCAEKGIDMGDWKTVCENKDVVATVLKSMQEVGKNDKLVRFEIPTKCYVTDIEWTPESGLVTAALKLKRNELNAHYKAQIDALYA